MSYDCRWMSQRAGRSRRGSKMGICSVMKHSKFAVPRQISRINCRRDGTEDEVETEAKEPGRLGIGVREV